MSNKPRANKKDDDLLADAIQIPAEDLTEEVEEELRPIEFDPGDDDEGDGTSEIHTFGERQHVAARWKRKPISSGQGASHVRTFVTKLRLDAVEHIDDQINEWLDENPDFDVKFVTTSVGPLIGKSIENAMFVSVWV